MKKTKKQLEAEKKRLQKDIERVDNRLKELSRPVPVGFNYKNRVV